MLAIVESYNSHLTSYCILLRLYSLWWNLYAFEKCQCVKTQISLIEVCDENKNDVSYTLMFMFVTKNKISRGPFFLAATKQLYEWFSPSVCLSVCPSVTPFWLCSHHRVIVKFSGVITNDKSDVHAKGQGQRSKVKVTEVNTQLNRFRTVTQVWIHIWWWNDTYSLMMLRRGALLFFKVIRQISRSHGSKKL